MISTLYKASQTTAEHYTAHSPFPNGDLTVYSIHGTPTTYIRSLTVMTFTRPISVN